MDNSTVKKSPIHGFGLFTTRKITKGEHILHKDLTRLKKYTLEEVNANPNGDHSDYVGGAYFNHSCDPSCYVKSRSIAVKDIYALRDIEEGEELALDYAANAVDQFAGKGVWVMYCKCGSQNCRGRVTADFFQLPVELQRMYFPHLPPYIRRKYRVYFATS